MHDHPEATPEQGEDDPNAALTLLVGAISVVLTVVIIVALQALFYRVERREVDRKVVESRPEEIRQVRVEQIEQINKYRWIDRDNGIVAIPIEQAMTLVVREQQDAPGAGGAR